MAGNKPKIAMYWCAGCGGCEESIVDLAENILNVIEAVDIVFWPVALDFKKKDVEAMPDASIAATFINGSIRTSEHEEMAKLLRKKTKFIVAHGSCSHMGGVPGLSNLTSKETMLEYMYKKTASTNNPGGVIPAPETKVNGHEIKIPAALDRVQPLDEVIKVDFYLPGCPPPAKNIMEFITAFLTGKVNLDKPVFAPNINLCSSCPRKETKTDNLKLTKINRFSLQKDSGKCFLEDGVICMGPVTRSGCGEQCVRANVPCRGCFGPLDGVTEQGAKFMSALGMVMDSAKEEEIDALINSIPDLTGTLYRYSFAASVLGKMREKKNG
jgi:F420-non-reducing hydrogenase small subunit